MTHAQIMRALSGLLLGLFAAILSSTVVTNALPRIISDLGGGQSAYTWVVTASLLTVTASTPLWGKLSDQFSKKILVQSALIIYAAGSLVAGLAQNPATLISARVIQGLGGGGLSALAQVVLAAMISPRERGRYSGYLGATFAVATVGGPLLGGVITDTSWLGWRWCLFVGIPVALVALVVLQKTLNLPVAKREAKVDWAGAFFVTAAVCVLLIWVTFADDKYDWLSWQTYTLLGASIVLALIFLFVETRASEPIIPLRLFRNPTTTLASIASLFVGIALFAGTVFFSQYFQLARGDSPTKSGIMTIPFIAGLFVSSTVSGRIITRTGKWKGWLLTGGAFLTAGLALLGMLRYDTSYVFIALCMALMGLGVGMTLQNLVLCTQNQVAPSDLGAASSTVTFFRSLGGAVGVSVLGSILTTRIGHYARETITQLTPQDQATAAQASGGGELPDLGMLPAPVRTWLENAYGHGIGDIFIYVAPIALIAFLVTLFIKEVPLRATSGLAQAAQTTDSAPDPTTTPAPATTTTAPTQTNPPSGTAGTATTSAAPE
ncbi:MDR family MFS transporter [Streptomyces brasiliensis]|nr:MDR family MFS transporter [Streptomyces brasiliensis]